MLTCSQRLAGFIGRYTQSASFVIGGGTLHEIFERRPDLASDGAHLQAIAQLFKDGLKLFVYPYLSPRCAELLTAESYSPGPETAGLYRYLLERGFVIERRAFGFAAAARQSAT